MKDNYSRPVSLRCATCGGNEFEFDEAGGPIRCNSCDRIYESKDELIAENGEHIDLEVQQLGADVLKGLQNDLSKMFKNLR